MALNREWCVCRCLDSVTVCFSLMQSLCTNASKWKSHIMCMHTTTNKQINIFTLTKTIYTNTISYMFTGNSGDNLTNLSRVISDTLYWMLKWKDIALLPFSDLSLTTSGKTEKWKKSFHCERIMWRTHTAYNEIKKVWWYIIKVADCNVIFWLAHSLSLLPRSP